MVEYKKLVHQESRLSLNGPYGSPSGEGVNMHPFSRISNTVADVVTESAADGKVFHDMIFPYTSFHLSPMHWHFYISYEVSTFYF